MRTFGGSSCVHLVGANREWHFHAVRPSGEGPGVTVHIRGVPSDPPPERIDLREFTTADVIPRFHERLDRAGDHKHAIINSRQDHRGHWLSLCLPCEDEAGAAAAHGDLCDALMAKAPS